MISSTGNIGFSVDSGGLGIEDNSRPVRLYKIVSGSNPYTATAVYLDQSSGARTATGEAGPTAAMSLLFEVNGNSSVPADTVVVAQPNPFGSGYFFSYVNPTGTNVFTAASADFTLSSATNVGQIITTLTLTVPSTGTWLINWTATANYNTNTPGDYLTIVGAGAASKFCTIQVSGVTVQQTVSGSIITTVSSAPQNYTLAGYRTFGGTVTTSTILRYGGPPALPVTPGTYMHAVKIA